MIANLNAPCTSAAKSWGAAKARAKRPRRARQPSRLCRVCARIRYRKSREKSWIELREFFSTGGLRAEVRLPHSRGQGSVTRHRINESSDLPGSVLILILLL